MAISSLGLGSGVLTQDVLDKLRKADEAGRITPIDKELKTLNTQKSEFSVLDATMTNFSDAVNELKAKTLYDERQATVTGTSVSVTADANSDVQDFTLNVTQLATKQIEESGSYGATTDTIASDTGNLTLSVGSSDFTINYDSTTTLEDLKKSINDIAGQKVNATIVQIASGDYRLFLNSVDTGSNQDISITDNSGNLSGTQLTDDLSSVQDGVDATFDFNGQAITRHSNQVDDLITGYHITLKEVGSSDVSVQQNRDAILKRVDSFIEKYNAAMTELDKVTKNSTNADERGVFSSESGISGMQDAIRNAMDTIGGGVGTIYDYGFDIDKDGKMSIDKTVFNKKLDENAGNVEVFFSGGSFDNGDGTTTTIDGAFTDLSTITESYTGYGKILDSFSKNLDASQTTLQERRTTTMERLNNKYETLQKQWGAYDALIARLNSSANAFIQMVNAQNNSQKN